ncbi:MAG: PilZ domain-containing protein [Candidatus Omnitrophica bacterium]|nr:PilZ domain-containing protein [Candidatus Omnitrophota bacterium]
MAFEEEYRRHARIQEETPVRWRLIGSERQGEGLVRDISVSGILLEVQEPFSLDNNPVFTIQAINSSDELFIPERARLVWTKMMKTQKDRYLCGLEFIRPPESIVAQIAQRVESFLARIAETGDINILRNYLRKRER